MKMKWLFLFCFFTISALASEPLLGHEDTEGQIEEEEEETLPCRSSMKQLQFI